MNEFLLVLLIAGFAALLTYLGAPVAERYDVPQRVVSAALQFAGGIIAALVAFSLMPPAVHNGPLIPVVLAFFLGGTLFVTIEYFTSQRQADPRATQAAGLQGFYIGILADLFIDGVVIGVGSTLTLKTGLLLALGMAISTTPLAFVTIATAKQNGMPKERRQRLAYLFFGCMMTGAILGYGLLRNQPEAIKLTLIALAAGFLITTVTQSIIPEANREGEPSFAGILFVAGISLYALLTLVVK
jgi:ZIP family zinc transporter